MQEFLYVAFLAIGFLALLGAMDFIKDSWNVFKKHFENIESVIAESKGSTHFAPAGRGLFFANCTHVELRHAVIKFYHFLFGRIELF
ncbi:hypothetical protein [Massilia varians]|nr:hypothetical protein [Massilia varians]